MGHRHNKRRYYYNNNIKMCRNVFEESVGEGLRKEDLVVKPTETASSVREKHSTSRDHVIEG